MICVLYIAFYSAWKVQTGSKWTVGSFSNFCFFQLLWWISFFCGESKTYLESNFGWFSSNILVTLTCSAGFWFNMRSILVFTKKHVRDHVWLSFPFCGWNFGSLSFSSNLDCRQSFSNQTSRSWSSLEKRALERPHRFRPRAQLNAERNSTTVTPLPIGAVFTSDSVLIGRCWSSWYNTNSPSWEGSRKPNKDRGEILSLSVSLIVVMFSDIFLNYCIIIQL